MLIPNGADESGCLLDFNVELTVIDLMETKCCE